MSQVGFLQTTLSPFFLPNLLGKPAGLDDQQKQLMENTNVF